MRISRWKDYELIDTSGGERLERWGNVILIRPDPQIIWRTPKNNPLWKNANAIYHRASTGGGAWENLKKIPEILVEFCKPAPMCRQRAAAKCGYACS